MKMKCGHNRRDVGSIQACVECVAAAEAGHLVPPTPFVPLEVFRQVVEALDLAAELTEEVNNNGLTYLTDAGQADLKTIRRALDLARPYLNTPEGG